MDRFACRRQYGAYVDLISSDLGRTSLHIASQYGFLKTVNTLLSGGADVTASDMDGNLSLHLAIRNGNTSVA